MRKGLVASLVALLLAALAPAARTDTSVLALARVRVDSRTQAAYVAGNYDETHNYVPGYVEVLLWPGDAAELDALGFDLEILSKDIAARDSALEEASSGLVADLPAGPDRSDYRRLVDYNSELKAIAEKYPSIAKAFELPNQTLEGRTVLGIEITGGIKDSDDGRPVFYMDGVHHAREWPAGEYPMIFAHLLAEKYSEDPRVTDLLDKVRVIIVPIVNVDGFDYSRESALSANQRTANVGTLTYEGYWRKNRRSFLGLTVPVAQKNPDAFGVDPNRNYGYKWGDSQGGSSGDRTSATYRGEVPFSEPESDNIRQVLLANNVTSAITNHTYSNLVLRPWGDTRESSPDEGILKSLGAKMATAMGGYQNIKSIDLYATTGTTQDWLYGALGAISYTFEHGEAFHPPYAENVGKDAPGVMEAFLLGVESAAKEDWHSVVTGRVLKDGKPVAAELKITKRFASPQWPNNPAGLETIPEAQRFSMDAPNGVFTWHLSPSTRPHLEAKGKTETYTLKVSVDGASAKTLSVEVARGQRLDVGTIRF